jgi:hypothetical protein
MDVQTPSRRRKSKGTATRASTSRSNGTRGNGERDASIADMDVNMRKLLRALQAVRDGDFSVRMPSDQTGLPGKVADTFNEIVSANQRMARELERAGQVVGKDGKTRHRVSMERRSGAWGAMEGSVNTLIDDLLWPTTEVTRTVAAVVKGDLSQAMVSRSTAGLSKASSCAPRPS